MTDTLARQRMIVGTTADWNTNDLILGSGEIALERLTTGEVKAKAGDGVKRFSQSPYITAYAAAMQYRGNANPTLAPPASVSGDIWSAMPAGTLASGWGAIAGQSAFAGDYMILDSSGHWNLVATAESGGAQAAIDAAEAAADSAEDAAAAAAAAAASAADANLSEQGAIAAASGLFFNTTAEALSKGVIGNGAITPGSGGTAGTFAGTVTGGGGTGAAFTFVVAGGAVTQIIWLAKGVNYTTAPTLGFAASAGLTAAAATAIIGPRTVDGQYFLVRTSASPTFAELWKNVAGVAVDQGQAIAAYDAVRRTDAGNLLYGPAAAQTIGWASAPTGGTTGAGDVTYGFISPAKVDSNIVAVRAFLGSTATALKIKIFDLVAGVWTQAGADVSLPAVTGANSYAVAGNTMSPIAIKAGQIVGFYSQGGPVEIDTTGPNFDVFSYSTAGNQTTLTTGPQATVHFRMGFDLAPVAGSVGIQTIGRNVANMPNAGSGTQSANTFAFATPALNPSNITAIRAYCGGAVTGLTIKIFKQISGVWTQSGADVSLPAAPGLNQYSVAANTMAPIFVPEGAIIGWFVVGGGGINYVLNPPFDGTFYNLTAGNAKTVDLFEAAGFRQIGFDLTPVAGLALQREPVDDAIDATERLKSPAIISVGAPSGSFYAANNFGAQTCWLGPVPQDGIIAAMRYWSATSGLALPIQSFRRAGDLFTAKGPIVTVTSGTGNVTATGVNLPVNAGDYIGIFANNVLMFAGDGVAGKNPFWNIGGNAIGAAYPATPGLSNTNNLIFLGFDISFGEFRGLKYQVIGQAAYNALGVYDPNTLYVIQGALRAEDRPAGEELPAIEDQPNLDPFTGEDARTALPEAEQ